MANITRELNEIKAANWGGNVRSAIALALEKVNEGVPDESPFVVTEIVMSEENTDAGAGDMTKAEILEAFSNGKIVVARIVNSDSSFVMCGFVAVTNVGLMVGPLLDEAVIVTMAGTEQDDCVTWTFSS